jgi:general secretion pathway protein C
MCLAVLFAGLIWVIASPQASVAALEARPLPSPVQPGGVVLLVDRTILVEANPFASDTVEAVPDAPETSLNLKLVGVLMSTAEFGGSAQITTPDNRTNRYVTEDEILPGVTLARIMSDRVMIRRNGDTETLLLSGRSSGLSVIGDSRESVDDAALVPVQTSGGVSEYALGDPDDLFRIINASPKQENGRLIGYSLFPRGDVDAFTAAGFVAGDVLIEVNGTMVTELDLRELRDEIGASQVATLTVERGGQPVTLRLRFEA